mmetsp:Transcript_8597/g.25628  ORF Transcript_8597/g.25628 Transcript_8597/m.25628 type:complete len:224 (+) Transcript_8597:795-1466(+)
MSISIWSSRERPSKQSISSITNARRPCVDNRPSKKWSHIRPGVPTTTMGKVPTKFCSWSLNSSPPTNKLAFKSGKGLSKSRTTRNSCPASSRLGATTMSRGLQKTFLVVFIFSKSDLAPRACDMLRKGSKCLTNNGNMNASVLPVPVGDVISTSLPARITLAACTCKRLGEVMPNSSSAWSTAAAPAPSMPTSSHLSSVRSDQLSRSATVCQGSGTIVRTIDL